MYKLENNIISHEICDELKNQFDKLFEAETINVGDEEVAGWFMGTRGENLGVVSEIILSVLNGVVGERELMFPNDPNYITPEIKTSDGYKKGINAVKEETENLITILNKFSLPTQSLRYQGHMLWDITLPSMIGYFAAMLQNQNNVTPQASPATTILELLVSNDIASMIGFDVKSVLHQTDSGDEIAAWTHISCDGSVANIESLWAARELKYFPLGIKHAIKDDYNFFETTEPIKIIINNHTVELNKASIWQLLNLSQDEILSLPSQIHAKLKRKKTLADVWSRLTSKYSLNAKGLQFFNNLILHSEDKIFSPCILVPSTKHYSWPKATSVLGFGNGTKGLDYLKNGKVDFHKIKDEGLINIYVKENGAMDTELLKEVLDVCHKNKKLVFMVVGVMGTTEEGAVDHMDEIIAIRNSFRMSPKKAPFEYSIHADAAWGGYFLACCREPFKIEEYSEIQKAKRGADKSELFDKKNHWFKDDVYQAMTSICYCDSVTIDPHKMGYIPYPAGSLTYRNDKIVNLLTFSAPYISSGNTDSGINTRNIGECGIEGSKSGAAAASVYLSHKVIRPDKTGYGKIINQSVVNSKIFYLYLNFIKEIFEEELKFEIVMFEEFQETDQKKKDDLIKHLKNDELDDIKEKDYLKTVGGDQNIIDYIFIDSGDRSIERTLSLNQAVFNALSLAPGQELEGNEIFVSMTTFYQNEYGNNFMKALGNRVCPDKHDPNFIPQAIPCIRSVIMDPWAMYAHKDKSHNFFKEVFVPELIKAVNDLCDK